MYIRLYIYSRHRFRALFVARCSDVVVVIVACCRVFVGHWCLCVVSCCVFVVFGAFGVLFMVKRKASVAAGLLFLCAVFLFLVIRVGKLIDCFVLDAVLCNSGCLCHCHLLIVIC